MKKIVIILFCLIRIICIGQNIKYYSGKYENGTANYQYYENENYERIFHGNFSYKENNFTLTGQFINNVRNGNWKATRIIKNYNLNETTIETVSASYKNGNLEGLCSYSKKNAVSNKELAKSTLFFKENIPIGKYSFISYEKLNNISVSIFLNSEGCADSVAVIRYTQYGKQFEDIRKYRNGFLYWQLYRDLTNGDIIKKTNKRKLINDMFFYYDSVLKVSIIPKASFVYNINDAPYLFTENNHYQHSFEYLDHIESDSAYYINTPFTFFRKHLYGDYGSLWNLYEGIYFWENDDCDYCGTRENPIYRVNKGANPVSFLIEKEIVINDTLLIKLQKKTKN